VYVLENRALYPIGDLRLTLPYEGIQVLRSLSFDNTADKLTYGTSVQLVIHPFIGKPRPNSSTEIADNELMDSAQTDSGYGKASAWNKFAGASSEIPSWCTSFDILADGPSDTTTGLPGLLATCEINPANRFGCPFHHMSKYIVKERTGRLDISERQGHYHGMGPSGFGFFEVGNEYTIKDRKDTLTKEQLAERAHRPINFEPPENLGYESKFMDSTPDDDGWDAHNPQSRPATAGN
jgi:hypothetical protein